MMKSLINYITEALISKKSRIRNEITINTKDELKEIIKTRISELNNNPNLNGILDLSDLDISQLTDLSYLFQGIDWNSKEKILYIDVTGWDTTNVTSMKSLFFGCWNTQDIYGIEDFNITNVTEAHAMFYKCAKIKSLDLSKWKPIKLTNISDMFIGCISLKSLGNIEHWINDFPINLSRLPNYYGAGMFKYCRKLKKPSWYKYLKKE